MQCPWEHSTAAPSTLKLSAIANGRNEINTITNKSNNGIDITTHGARQPKFFGFFGPPADTKEFKTGYELNPAVVDRLSAFISFGKSHVRTPACADTPSSTTSTSSSSSSFTSSSASASASSSSSSSISSASSSSSSSGAIDAHDTDQASAGASPGSLPSSASISASESELPTNGQYYPIATAEETQANHDIVHHQQYNDEQQNGSGNIFGKFDAQKKAWTHIVDAPAHALQKMRKFHADVTGLGPLYGTDHFAPRNIHRSTHWILGKWTKNGQNSVIYVIIT